MIYFRVYVYVCVCKSYLLSATLYPLHKRCTNCVGPDDAGPIIAIGALLPIDFCFITELIRPRFHSVTQLQN